MISLVSVLSHDIARSFRDSRDSDDPTVVVSILGDGTDPLFVPGPRIHTLTFDDVDGAERETRPYSRVYRPLTLGQARGLLAFLARWQAAEGAVPLVAHCWAGVSRSAGVAHYLHQRWGIPYRTAQREFWPNPWVVDQLRRAETAITPLPRAPLLGYPKKVATS